MENRPSLSRRKGRKGIAANKKVFSTSCPQPSRQKEKSQPVDEVMEDVSSVENDPENSFDPSTKTELIDEIKAKYVSVKKKQDQHAATEGYNLFHLAMASEIFEGPFVPVPEYETEEIKPKANRKSKEKVAKFRGPQNKLSTFRVIPLQPCPSPPSMSYFINTNINIVGKDRLFLQNYPYLGDGDYDDAELLKNLKKLFPGGISGAKRGWGKPINDSIMFAVCDPILKRNNWKMTDEIERLMIPMHELFPNRGSPREMARAYLDLVRKFDPESLPVKNSVFNENGEIAGHLAPEVIQHTNSQLVCKRCFIVDCMFHPDSVTENDAHIERDDERIADIEEACGPDCYKVSKSVDKVEWTGEEKSYIDMLLAADIDNTCRISQFLSSSCADCSKTCKQVDDYINGKEARPPVHFDANRIVGNDRRLQEITTKERNAFLRSRNGVFTNSLPYQSCKHPGACSVENGCSCQEDNIVCTKFCACPTTCTSRFPGCKCLPGMCNNRKCECFLASWECDPDFCRSCNCDADEEDVDKKRCNNANIQRGLSRKLYIDRSTVAGTGCFSEEAIPKDEYIGEYCGEIISHDESERRGAVYDAYKRSYTFNLNDEQAIDATRFGNIMRFINHSDEPNCTPKILVVNGEHRIGFFALKNIEAREELFFNYAYSKRTKAMYSFVERKSS